MYKRQEGMRAADSALIVVSGKDGVNVGTEKAVKAATKACWPTVSKEPRL